MSTKLDIKVFTDQVQKELDDANRKFPAFNSDHEGYAVLLEEYQELVCEFQNVEYYLGNSWDSIKKGDHITTLDALEMMRIHLCESYKELVQTAAMVEKWLDRYRADRNLTDVEPLARKTGLWISEEGDQ